MALAMVPVALFSTSAVAASDSPVRVAYTDGNVSGNIIIDQVAHPGIAAGNGFDVTLGAGDHTFALCTDPLATHVDGGLNNCLDADNDVVGSLVVADVVNLPNANSNYTVVVNATAVPSIISFENDLSLTGLGEARFQLNNASLGNVSVCVDRHDGAGLVLQPGLTDISSSGGQGSGNFTATQNAEIYVGSSAADCSTYSHFSLSLPAGTAFVLTATNSGSSFGTPACGAACSQALLVGEDSVPNNPDTVAFCNTILAGPESLSGFGPALKALVGNVDPTTTETIHNSQPNVDSMKAFVVTYQGVLEAGDATVPASVADAWATATAGIRKILTTFQLVNYDLSKLPPAAVKDIVLGANGVKLPGVPVDEDLAAATEAITAFVTGTCLATPPGPAPTPGPGPTPAAPVNAGPRFTG
jgi:hypothetical protein